ncbi:TPA: hypothetical protein ACJSX9_000190 [Streptococcus agalactiae]
MQAVGFKRMTIQVLSDAKKRLSSRVRLVKVQLKQLKLVDYQQPLSKHMVQILLITPRAEVLAM